MKINEIIKKRRIEANISDGYIVNKLDLSPMTYYDIEKDESEVIDQISLGILKDILDILGLDVMELFNSACPFCLNIEEYKREYELPRNELIRKRRIEHNYSEDEFAEMIDFYREGVDNLESKPDYLDNSSISSSISVSRVLEIPLQILINAKCKACGK